MRKYNRRIMLRMEFSVIRIPYISVIRSAMMTDDRVRLVYFDEKRTSISNVIVIFHVFFGLHSLLLKGKLQTTATNAVTKSETVA